MNHDVIVACLCVCRSLQSSSATSCGQATSITKITSVTSWQRMWQSATHIKSASAGDDTISAVRKHTYRCTRSFVHALLSVFPPVALRCPPGKEYQPCVSTCTSRTCLNREYYEETTCSFIREECVCRSGTILHRADSPYCVTEDRCGEWKCNYMHCDENCTVREFWTVPHVTPPLVSTCIISVFMWVWCIYLQCARIMTVTPGPQARCGMALLAAAVFTNVWRTALWWLSNQTVTLSPRHCVRGRESMCWMYWKKEPAAPRRSAVS